MALNGKICLSRRNCVSERPGWCLIRTSDLVIEIKAPQHQGYEKCYNGKGEGRNQWMVVFQISNNYFHSGHWFPQSHWPRILWSLFDPLARVKSNSRRRLSFITPLTSLDTHRTAKKKLSDPVNRENRHESYRALEQLYREGKIRHIGISNFTARHMEELLATCTIVPHVHQFELHPRLVQQDLLRLCAKYKIQVQAYSSLGEGRLLEDKEIREIAEQNGLSSAQVLLRWAVQHGWVVIPKSSNPGRVRMNASIFAFELSEEVCLFVFPLRCTSY